MQLADTRYELRDLTTNEVLMRFFHRENIPAQARYERRKGRKVYVVDTQNPS